MGVTTPDWLSTMTFNPYARGSTEPVSNLESANTALPGGISLCRRAAEKGARIAGYMGGTVSLLLIVPSLAMSAFALGAGRGLGLSMYFFGGLGLFVLSCVVGGMIGGVVGWIWARLGRLRLRGQETSPGPGGQTPAAVVVETQSSLDVWNAGRPSVQPGAGSGDPRPTSPGPGRQTPAAGRGRRAWGRFVRILRWLALALMLLLVICAFFLGRDVGKNIDQRLAAAIAVADRDDRHWRLDDLLAHREAVPDDENAALVMDQVHALVPDKWPERERAKVGGEPPPEPSAEEAFRMLEMTPGNFRMADPVVKTIRGELTKYQKAVTLAWTVAHYRRGRHELKIGRAVIDTLLPQTVQARTVGRLLTADAAIRAHDGDIDGALDSCRANIAAGRSIGDEPFLISQVFRMAIVEVAAQVDSAYAGSGRGIRPGAGSAAGSDSG